MDTICTGRYVLYSTTPFQVLQHFLDVDTLHTASKLEILKGANHADSEIGCCSLGAAVQGMDETAVNGAQLVSLCREVTASLPVFSASLS